MAIGQKTTETGPTEISIRRTDEDSPGLNALLYHLQAIRNIKWISVKDDSGKSQPNLTSTSLATSNIGSSRTSLSEPAKAAPSDFGYSKVKQFESRSRNFTKCLLLGFTLKRFWWLGV
jgi:hypothetical protein